MTHHVMWLQQRNCIIAKHDPPHGGSDNNKLRGEEVFGNWSLKRIRGIMILGHWPSLNFGSLFLSSICRIYDIVMLRYVMHFFLWSVGGEMVKSLKYLQKKIHSDSWFFYMKDIMFITISKDWFFIESNSNEDIKLNQKCQILYKLVIY